MADNLILAISFGFKLNSNLKKTATYTNSKDHEKPGIL